jgi:hypothetical protein
MNSGSLNQEGRAWPYESDDGKPRFFAVLHTPRIDGPRKAVQAAIVAEARAAK